MPRAKGSPTVKRFGDEVLKERLLRLLDLAQRSNADSRSMCRVALGLNVPSKLQSGPMCGLTALSMAAEFLNCSKTPPALSQASLESSLESVEREFRETSIGDVTSSVRKHGNSFSSEASAVSSFSDVPSVPCALPPPIFRKFSDESADRPRYDHLDVDSASLLRMAVNEGLTAHGEMFSAATLAQLARTHYPLCAEVCDDVTWQVIASAIAHGHPVLIPYDADRNHSPCLKRGHKAHWAVITGVCFQTEASAFTATLQQSRPSQVTSSLNNNQPVTMMAIWAGSNTDCNRFDSKCMGLSGDGREVSIDGELWSEVWERLGVDASMYVLGQQGKSRHPGLWAWTDLRDSNRQLWEPGCDVTDPGAGFKVPTDMRATLASRAVILKPLPSL